MSLSMLEEKLQQLGFSQNEVKVYLKLLDLGKSRLYELSRHIGLNHVTTLFNLRSLERKRVIYIQKIGKQKYYYIEHPRYGLKRYLQNFEDQVHRKREMIEQSLEGFEIRYASLENKASLKIFEGEDVFQAVIQELLHTPFERFYEFCSSEDAQRVLANRSVRSKLRKLKGKYFSLCAEPLPWEYRRKTFPNSETKFISKDTMTILSANIMIFSDKVLVLNLQPGMKALLLRDGATAEVLKFLFEGFTKRIQSSDTS